MAKELTVDSRVKAATHQMTCDLAGEAAILNLQSGIYFGLDPVGARVWELVQQSTTVADIRDALLEEYEVEPEVVEADIKALLISMREHGLVEALEVEEPSGS
jgi:hypothetical protein